MPIATPAPPHPHLPVPLGELSVWQRSTRNHPLLNAGIDAPLPAEADVVIIGSGMCGAVIAHTLLSAPNRPQRVVVVEAREICSGASGRNAGHCRPDAARGFTAFQGMHGPEQAKHVLASEHDVFRRVDEFVTKNTIDCEWTPRPTYDVCLTDEFKTYEADALAGLRRAGGEPEGFSVLDAEDAQKATRVPDAVGAYKWSAATLNPAKLTLGVHALNVEMGGYELYAYAPVHRVECAESAGASGKGEGEGEGEGEEWSVITPRGAIRTPRVVFATNAYSQAIVPELEGLVVPWRAQAVKLPAPPVGSDVFPPLEPS